MNGVGSWFHNLGTKMKAGFSRFMAGRYGTDKLNSVILWTGVVFCLVSMLIPLQWASLMMAMLAYVCMFWAIFRSFSRNTYKRYQENRRYVMFWERIRDRDHKYFTCPHCRQQVRVPKGKGKVSITCPRCHEKFVRKT